VRPVPVLVSAMLSLGLVFAGVPAVTAEAKAVYTWKEARNAKIPKESSITKKQKKKYYKIAEDEFEYKIKSNQRILSTARASTEPAQGESDQRVAAAGGVWQDVKDEFSRYDICNPYGTNPNRNFCSPSKGYRDYMYSAWEWGKKHPDKDDWKPAHKPTAGTGLTNKWGFVYVITYRPKGFIGPLSAAAQVWKFGETAQSDWTWRAGISLAQCDLDKARICDVELVAISEKYPSKYIVRWVEAAAIAKWNRELGKGGKDRNGIYYACPPGQNISCR
jgi:hypothetical protein